MSSCKVAVGLSGGVDSSVAAAFLKNKGYDVVGLTVKFYTDKSNCSFPSEEDINNAKKICKILNIPHYLIDMEDKFREEVIDYFVSEYLSARTPNPCAVCNQKIKFGILLDEAEKKDCSFLATGHYAVVYRDEKSGKFKLCRGKEHGKDQSYFLARISQKKLSKILFPVGTFPKSKIRKLAGKFGLPVSNKMESQEVCFIKNEKIYEFIEKYKDIKLKEGQIKNSAGETIGIHNGIAGFTIGQRRGLGVAVGKPVFVNKIDLESNTIFIGKEKTLYKSKFFAKDLQWFQDKIPVKPVEVDTRIRYAHVPAASEIVFKNKKNVLVTFKKPQRAITPGQLAVFYQENEVVGSAWIKSVLD